jgi:hypothetical protein
MAKWQGSRVEAVPHCHFSHGYHYLEKLHGGRGRNLLILGSRPGGTVRLQNTCLRNAYDSTFRAWARSKLCPRASCFAQYPND